MDVHWCCAIIALGKIGEQRLRLGLASDMSGQMIRGNSDERFMRDALREARRGLGLTSPNPAVGAVLVIKNKIVSRGHHEEAGTAHAEVECLTDFSRKIPTPSTLYVTLEPCSTIGRTGPCTNAIITPASKIWSSARSIQIRSMPDAESNSSKKPASRCVSGSCRK